MKKSRGGPGLPRYQRSCMGLGGPGRVEAMSSLPNCDERWCGCARSSLPVHVPEPAAMVLPGGVENR